MNGDVKTTIFRAPNADGSVQHKAQSEVDILLEEFAYSHGFKLFLNEVITPIVIEIRSTLLSFSDLTEAERVRLVARMDMLKRILEDLYGRTAEREMPQALQNFFR